MSRCRRGRRWGPLPHRDRRLSRPFDEATAAALWQWRFHHDAQSIQARFAVLSPEEGGTGNAQVRVAPPRPIEALAPTDPPTVPLSSLTVRKKRDPDVSAQMLFLSQD